MAKIGTLKTDLKKAKEGVWVDYAAGIRLKIASISNRAYRDAVEMILKPHMNRIRHNLMPAEERLDLLKPAIAQHILIGWDNIEDDNGQKIPYSAAKALEFFKDPTLEDFFSFVVSTAGESEAYRSVEVEEAKENLSRS